MARHPESVEDDIFVRLLRTWWVGLLMGLAIGGLGSVMVGLLNIDDVLPKLAVFVAVGAAVGLALGLVARLRAHRSGTSAT